MKRKLLPIVLLSLLLGLLFDFLFYGKAPGVSVLLFSAYTLLATWYIARYYRKPLKKPVFLLMAPVLFFSAMVLVRANGFLIFLNIVAVIYLMLLCVQLAAQPHHKIQNYTLSQYIGLFFVLPFRFIGEFFGVGQSMLESRGDADRQKHSVAPVVRGVLLSLPFLFVFLLLFSSADLVFKRYIGSLFDFSLSPILINHAIFIFFIGSLFVGAYALLFLRSNTEEAKVEQKTSKFNLGCTESSIILGSVGVLFLAFVLIQITYLFGGQSNVVGTGFTYAEYARKGFFELIVVALISLVLLLALNNTTARSNLKQKAVFMWLSGALIIEVMVIMVSAFRRLGLYEQAYGFTELRLYSHLFIMWLAIIFVLLFVHIFREQKANQFAFRVFLSVIVFLGGVNLLNPDAFIARHNIQRFYKTGKMDFYYLANISDDAIPEISKSLQSSNEQLQKSVARDLYYIHIARSAEQPRPWQSFNIAHNRARDILQKNAPLLEANKGYHLEPIPTEFQD